VKKLVGLRLEFGHLVCRCRVVVYLSSQALSLQDRQQCLTLRFHVFCVNDFPVRPKLCRHLLQIWDLIHPWLIGPPTQFSSPGSSHMTTTAHGRFGDVMNLTTAMCIRDRGRCRYAVFEKSIERLGRSSNRFSMMNGFHILTALTMTGVYMSVCGCICMCVCMFVCLFVCMCVCVCW
jgi:hypothetical protein